MEEQKARRVVDALREVGVPAQLERPGVYAFGVGVQLNEGRLAVWGADSELSATVLRDGVLVGFVPALPAGLSELDLAREIARTDYEAPAGQRRTGPVPVRPALPRRGLLARVMDGLR